MLRNVHRSLGNRVTVTCPAEGQPWELPGAVASAVAGETRGITASPLACSRHYSLSSCVQSARRTRLNSVIMLSLQRQPGQRAVSPTMRRTHRAGRKTFLRLVRVTKDVPAFIRLVNLQSLVTYDDGDDGGGGQEQGGA